MKKTKSFWQPVKVKPFINLNLYPSRSRQERGIINKYPSRDSDRDGTMNWFDCKPLNKKKHSKMLREEIMREVISPDDIRTLPSGKKMNVSFPSVGELKEAMEGNYGREVPPKDRVRLLTKKHIVRVLERNPDVYAKIKKGGVKVEMKNSFDAVHAGVPEYQGGRMLGKLHLDRSLATYRPGYAKIQVNPIRDIKDPTLLKTLKHEAIHVEQKFKPHDVENAEREARRKTEVPTAREAKKMNRRAYPETLKSISARDI